jgi:hypothetical protein
MPPRGINPFLVLLYIVTILLVVSSFPFSSLLNSYLHPISRHGTSAKSNHLHRNDPCPITNHFKPTYSLLPPWQSKFRVGSNTVLMRMLSKTVSRIVRKTDPRTARKPLLYRFSQLTNKPVPDSVRPPPRITHFFSSPLRRKDTMETLHPPTARFPRSESSA